MRKRERKREKERERERPKESTNHTPRVSQVNEEVIRHRQELVQHVAHNHHLWSSLQLLLQVVILHGTIERDESDLRPRLPGQAVQRRRYRVDDGGEHAALHGVVGHVDHEHVYRGLWGPHHVLSGSDKLDGACGQLWSLSPVRTLACREGRGGEGRRKEKIR